MHVDCIRKSLTSSSSESSLAALASTNAADYVCPICQGVEMPGSARVLSPSQSQPILGQFQPNYGETSAQFQEATTPSSGGSMDENEEAETEMLAIFMKSKKC